MSDDAPNVTDALVQLGVASGTRIAKGVQRFGFFGQRPVEPATRADYDHEDPDRPLFRVWQNNVGQVFVDLPHQCDEWCVAWGTQEDAIIELNAFLAAGIVALGKLMNGEIEDA